MRNLLIIGMLLVAASMAGWFQINRQGDETTIKINSTEIRGDTRRMIDKGREYLDRRDQQYAEQGQVDPQTQQQYWPQEQVAAQQQWNQNYGGQGQVYPPPTYQNQQYPAQQQQYPAPQYYPQQ